jgi:nicotinamidase-related amidase
VNRSMRLNPDSAALVVVDMQEGFRNAVPDFALIASRIVSAVRGFQALGLPVIVSEQYPKGLGHTAEEIQLVFDESQTVIEKTAFSAAGVEAFEKAIVGKEQIVLAGLEAHICVSQTAIDLIDRGLQVHVLTDCVASRFDYNTRAGLHKMRRAGVIEATVESVLFELLRDSSHPKFKEIQALVK